MKALELIQAKRDSFPVRELQRMLGIKKTDSYWILKNRNIQTVTVNGKMRILKDSFWNWYSNQTKYHIIDGPEPGSVLKETSYSVHDIMGLLDVSEYIVYTLIGKGVFDVITVDHQMRVTKESFERWYPTQEKYRLSDDRIADSEIRAETYSLPEIGRILGLHRNTVYSIIKSPQIEIVKVAGQQRVTIESFECWYSSQSKYKRIISEEDIKSQISVASGEGTGVCVQEISDNQSLPKAMSKASKDAYKLEDLMTALGVSRKVAYKLIQTGDIIAVKAGKSYIIPASEYKRYIERRNENGFDYSKE